MFIIGIILLIVGFLLGIQLLWVIGIVLATIGGVLFLTGSVGRPIGPRRHYW